MRIIKGVDRGKSGWKKEAGTSQIKTGRLEWKKWIKEAKDSEETESNNGDVLI